QLRVSARPRELDEVIAHLRWKYYANPAGEAIGVVAEADHKLAGVVSSIPLAINSNGNPEIFHLGASTAVDESFRGGFVLSQLFKEFYAEHRRRGTRAIFGFPNRAAYTIGERRFAYQQLLRIYDFHIPLRYSTLARRFSLPGKTPVLLRACNKIAQSMLRSLDLVRPFSFLQQGRLAITEVREVSADYSNFWFDAAPSLENAVFRDQQYVVWRFFQEPYAHYRFFEARRAEELIGYFVLAPGSVVRVIDFCTKTPSLYAEDLFWCLLAVASNLPGAQTLRFIISDSRIEELICSVGAQCPNFSFFSWVRFDQDPDLNRFTRPDKWYISANEYGLG
ncbi:MAG TPA: GNAT family N-acetyltransferase, partial [Oligoflexia bacterium]|nr:GNAT family N-acetyltransferase [Oligoflexia bacterium]